MLVRNLGKVIAAGFFALAAFLLTTEVCEALPLHDGGPGGTVACTHKLLACPRVITLFGNCCLSAGSKFNTARDPKPGETKDALLIEPERQCGALFTNLWFIYPCGQPLLGGCGGTAYTTDCQ
jgi:hypothetical protein